jgi:hypothetical protein
MDILSEATQGERDATMIGFRKNGVKREDGVERQEIAREENRRGCIPLAPNRI